MSAGVPKFFDLDVLALRRARARRINASSAGSGRSDFILDFAIEDVLDRLSFVTRPFRHALVFGEAAETLLVALRERIEVDGTVMTIDPLEFAALAEGDVMAGIAARLAETGHAFDVVVSPVTLQVMDDLPGVLSLLRQAMVPDGLLLANVIGGETLHELRSCLIEAEAAMTGGAAARVHPMIDVRGFGALLQRAGFALPVADSDMIDVSYRSSLDLMADLRAMARTNVLTERSRRFLTRAVLADTEARYQVRFPAPNGRLKATFEIVTGTGWVPHESQQKPLKPGTATTRLADALKPSALRPEGK